MKRPFNFRIAPLMLLSIVLAILAITYGSNSTILMAVIVAVILLLSAIFIKGLKKARCKLIVCILTFFLFLGLTTMTYTRVENKQIYSEGSLIEAEIDILTDCDEKGEVQIAEDALAAAVCLKKITVDGVAIDGKAYAIFSDPTIFDGYAIGDRIKFRGNIAPQNLVVEDSYSILNYKNRIYHYIYCNVDFEADDFCFYRVSSGMNLMDKIKIRVKGVLYSWTREDTAGFLYAMTFGDRSGLSSEIKDSFSYTGTAHVFAVSGLHVGILASGLLWLFKKLRLNNHVIRLVVMAVILTVFSALCGFSPSTVRASLMTILLMLSKAIGMRNDRISGMSLAAILILLYDQILLFDIGFLMSFLSVFGIFAFYKPINKFLRKIKIPKKLSGLIATSLSVNVVLLPLMMNYFSSTTLLFIIANLLLLPVLAVLFPIYLTCVSLAAILPFMGWSVTLIAFPFTLLMMLINWISTIPTFLINFNSNWVVIIFGLISAIMLSEYVFVHKKGKWISGAVMVVALLFTAGTSIRYWGSSNLYVYCFADSYDCQYVLIDNAYGGNYLVINDKTSSDSVPSVLEAMGENKFGNIDAIIVVGEIEETDLAKLQMYTNCPYVYSLALDDGQRQGVRVGSAFSESGLTVGFYNAGTLDIVSGKITLRVLAEDYYDFDDFYDILVTYNIVDGDTDGKYLVCDVGFSYSVKNCVPSTFTFELNNDKIKVQSSWRY